MTNDQSFMSQSAITVTVKLFAAYQEAYQQSEIVLQFPLQTPAIAVLEHLISQHPELEKWQEITRFGINCQFVSADTLLVNGDEVVLIPPVSGG